jgi:pimeloyl-ACP methyl ester carboxylesterase
VTTRRRTTAIIAAAACAAPVIAAVPASAVPTSARPATSLASWGPCARAELADAGFQCASLKVPLDRKSAKAGTITLALTRRPATGEADQRVGSLVFNPGGPGGSGLDAAPSTWDALPEDVKARFDLVTWDPRGIGASTPALRACAQPLPDRPLTGKVDWSAVVAGFQADLAAANADCQAGNARIAPHMGTNENVEDLDRIRAAVGDAKLTYWGMSYGTRIGYVYALKHPGRARAIVLDGSIDPAGTTLGLMQGGAGPDQALGSVAQAYPTVGNQLNRIVRTLAAKTVSLPRGQVLDRWIVLDPISQIVGSQDAYTSIAGYVDLINTALFGSGEAKTRAAGQLSTVVASLRKTSTNGGNAGGAFSIVNCLDYAGRPGLPAISQAVRYQVSLGPLFGGTLATEYGVGCAGLTLAPDPIPLITGSGSRVPVLILGSSRDAATVNQWTARMSRAFPASRTVTYAGGQHVVWAFARSWCVDYVADSFVMDLQLPRADIGCPNIYLPDDQSGGGTDDAPAGGDATTPPSTDSTPPSTDASSPSPSTSPAA